MGITVEAKGNFSGITRIFPETTSVRAVLLVDHEEPGIFELASLVASALVDDVENELSSLINAPAGLSLLRFFVLIEPLL